MRRDRISDALLPPAGSMGAKLGQALLWKPLFVRDDKRLWHLPFIFWLLETTQPTRYVEIGAGEGVGYMAVCQVLHRMRAHARCYAVGDWRNCDGQSGGLAPFAARNSELYGEFSEILDRGIDQAANVIDDRSVDLLLVDLTIAPEAAAVLHKRWIPKLSGNGILLINGVDRSDEATAILVAGLCANSPTFRMPGGDGLLVVLPSDGFENEFSKLSALGPDDPAQKLLIGMFTRLGAGTYYEAHATEAGHRVRALDEKAKELWKQRDNLSSELHELREQYESRHRKAATLQSLEFDLRRSLAASESELEQTRSDLGQVNLEIQSLQRLLDLERAERSTSERSLHQATASAAESALRIQELQERFAENLKLLEREQTSRSVEQNRYRAAIERLEDERVARKSADKEKERAAKEIQTIRRHLADLKEEAQQSHRANRALIEHAEESENIIAALSEELRLVRKQIRSCLIGSVGMREVAPDDNGR